MPHSRHGKAPEPEHPRLQDHDDDATAETPLLPTDLPPQVAPSKKTVRFVVGMVFFVYVAVMIANDLMDAPRQQLLEEVICKRHFADYEGSGPGVYDARCKNNEVQKTLAMVTAWQVSLQSAVTLPVQLPFAILADKYGRTWLMCLTLTTLFLETLWELAILYWNEHISSIWVILYGNLFYLAGGGVPMILTMGSTILSDVLPAAERGRVFYSLQAAMLIQGFFSHNVSATLLKTSGIWLPIWIGVGITTIIPIAAATIPNTLQYRRLADKQKHPDDDASGSGSPLAGTSSKDVASNPLKRTWATIMASSMHIRVLLFRSKMVLLAIVTYGFLLIVKLPITVIVLQYMSKRFDMTWSTATYYISMCNVSTAIFYLVGLPLLSKWLTNYHGLGPVSRDLALIRILAIAFIGSMVILSFADAAWVYIPALILASFGSGLTSILRGHLSSVVEPHTVATLFTTLELVTSINGFWGYPVMGWLEGKGMEIGGVWTGLPYMVCTILMVLVTMAIFLYRPPREAVQAESEVEEDY